MPRSIAHAALVILIVAGAACNRAPKAPPKPAEPAKPAHTLTADALVKEYQQNTLGADQKYKNQYIQLSGTIGKIGKGPLGHPYVQLGSAQEDDLFGVQCFITEASTAQAAQMKPGDAVKLRGTCTGQFGGSVLRLQDCEFVKP